MLIYMYLELYDIYLSITERAALWELYTYSINAMNVQIPVVRLAHIRHITCWNTQRISPTAV